MTKIVLLNRLYFAIKQFIQSAKIKQSSRCPQKEGGFHRVYFIQHGIVVDGQFFKNTNQEMIGVVRVTKTVVVYYSVLLTHVVSAIIFDLPEILIQETDP